MVAPLFEGGEGDAQLHGADMLLPSSRAHLSLLLAVCPGDKREIEKEAVKAKDDLFANFHDCSVYFTCLHLPSCSVDALVRIKSVPEIIPCRRLKSWPFASATPAFLPSSRNPE
jgi:hypothetical protein